MQTAAKQWQGITATNGWIFSTRAVQKLYGGCCIITLRLASP